LWWKGAVQFSHIANLFEVSTIDACFDHDGAGPCGGIKSEQDEWNLAGHKHRIIMVDEAALRLFAELLMNRALPRWKPDFRRSMRASLLQY